MSSNKILLVVSFFSVVIASVISSYYLFDLSNSEKNNHQWSDLEKKEWISDCLSIGYNNEHCECIMSELQSIYSKKEDMFKKTNEMAKNMKVARDACK